MSNLDRQAPLTVCGGRGFVVAEPVRELLSPRRVQLGESTEVRRLLPNLGRMDGRSLGLRRPLRAGRHRRRTGHAGPAPPAHGAPDRQLAPRGRGPAPRLHRQPPDRPAARTGADDLGARHLPLGGEPQAARPLPARCPALGGPPRHPPPCGAALRAPRRPAAGHGPGTDGHGRPRRARRRHLARYDVHPARRRRPRPRHAAPRRTSRWTPTSSTRSWPCPARSTSTASPSSPVPCSTSAAAAASCPSARPPTPA